MDRSNSSNSIDPSITIIISVLRPVHCTASYPSTSFNGIEGLTQNQIAKFKFLPRGASTACMLILNNILVELQVLWDKSQLDWLLLLPYQTQLFLIASFRLLFKVCTRVPYKIMSIKGPSFLSFVVWSLRCYRKKQKQSLLHPLFHETAQSFGS